MRTVRLVLYVLLSVAIASAQTIVQGAPVTISAMVTDNVGVAGVQFKLDGANLGLEKLIPPFSMVWNTANVTVGTHALTAVARDPAGNMATSNTIVLTITSPPQACDLTFTVTRWPTGTQGSKSMTWNTNMPAIVTFDPSTTPWKARAVKVADSNCVMTVTK